MKIPSATVGKRGFTLMELMVAMAITTIIVTVLVSITSIALDTWNRSRAELRASRQAKSMIDTMARDFESLVIRKGNSNQWLSAIASPSAVGTRIESTNASELIFFSAVTDRYDGQIGVANKDMGGDVSCVAYKLDFRDPITTGGADFKTFVLYRLLVNPDQTFNDLLGKPDLSAAFSKYSNSISSSENFVCENIFQFSVTFNVQVSRLVGGVTSLVTVPITIGKDNSTSSTKHFKISGLGIESEVSPGAVSASDLAAGRITSVDIAVTVISDFGIDQMNRRTFSGTQQSEFLLKNSYEYTKSVQIPSM